jgi:hypothetical protein
MGKELLDSQIVRNRFIFLRVMSFAFIKKTAAKRGGKPLDNAGKLYYLMTTN